MPEYPAFGNQDGLDGDVLEDAITLVDKIAEAHREAMAARGGVPFLIQSEGVYKFVLLAQRLSRTLKAVIETNGLVKPWNVTNAYDAVSKKLKEESGA